MTSYDMFKMHGGWLLPYFSLYPVYPVSGRPKAVINTLMPEAIPEDNGIPAGTATAW